MAIIGLALVGAYFAIAFGLRTWLQVRRTGDSGFRGLSGHVGSVEWFGGVLFVVAMAAAVGGPVTDLAGVEPIDGLHEAWIQVTGIVLVLIGIVTTFASQVSMGTSWRIGVDAGESTDLVTDGAFGLVRNPIFTSMGFTAVGLALVVPNVVALIGLLTLIVAIEMQVRGAEEPYLRSVHGDRWDAYSARVGRFIPRLGTTRSLKSTTGAR